MKTSTTAPRKPRKTSSTSVAKAAPTERKVAAPRVRRATAKPRKTVETAGVPPAHPTSDDVRFRAYEIYLQRSGVGDELSDWLQAERELLA